MRRKINFSSHDETMRRRLSTGSSSLRNFLFVISKSLLFFKKYLLDTRIEQNGLHPYSDVRTAICRIHGYHPCRIICVTNIFASSPMYLVIFVRGAIDIVGSSWDMDIHSDINLVRTTRVFGFI